MVETRRTELSREEKQVETKNTKLRIELALRDNYKSRFTSNKGYVHYLLIILALEAVEPNKL
jgi:hypothetical protein